MKTLIIILTLLLHTLAAPAQGKQDQDPVEAMAYAFAMVESKGNQQAYNARENAVTNGVEITLKLGDANALQGEFDIIIANINRNILLADMERYAAVLKAGGTLLLSGFYEADEGVLVARANELGMILKGKKNRDGWSALELILNS